MKPKRLYLAFLILTVLLLCGCGKADTVSESNADSGPKGKSYFTYFDTVSYVYSYANDSAEQFDERSADVSSVLSDYNILMDIYKEYSGVNNLCTLNKNAGGDYIELDEKLIDFLIYSKELYYTTNGKMNVMLGSVLHLWHNCREAASEDPKNATIPNDEELFEASKHTGIELLEIDKENNRARITDKDASIDVGALGKGYATEMAARMLEEKGVSSYALNIGGNIRIIGTKPDGSSWKTGIKNPSDPDGEFALVISIADTACVTSGVYERYFTVDGVRYHHIIDEETLYPANYFSSITVITKNSALADALSTALFCMPYEEGLEMINSIGNVEALWIDKNGEKYYSAGMYDIIVNE